MRRTLLIAAIVWGILCSGPVVADDLILTGWHLDDNGDGDGIPDTGETVTIRVQIENRADSAHTGVVARLSGSDSAFACVVQGVVAVGDIAPGATVVSSQGFEMQVGDVERSGQCSGSPALCADDADCPGAESCEGVAAQLDFTLAVTLSSDQSGQIGRAFPLSLAYDLDVAGGGSPTAFFEGFESLTDPGVTVMNLDFGTQTGNPTVNAQGYRCQYNDPDWLNSNSYGQVTDCYMGATPAQVDAAYWQVDGPDAVAPGRSWEGLRSLHMGIPLGGGLGHTTPTAGLEAALLSEPLALGHGRFCAPDGLVSCAADTDCAVGESCLEIQPVLSIRHQVSLMDYRTVNARILRSADRAVVQAQVVDAGGAPLSPWERLEPFLNVHDQQAEDNYTNCMFDPVDDGNTEDDLFDPLDPFARLGPSSTCFPAKIFAFIGSTEDLPGCPQECAGNAGEGPAESGATGAGAWVESRFSLDRFRGRRIQLRFLSTAIKVGPVGNYEDLFQHNPDPGDDGWWIDGVSVNGLFAEPATARADTDPATPPSLADGDGDGLFDVCDNCAAVPNSEQEDGDGDLIGDLCDACPQELVNDADGDGLCCPLDNCCGDANPLQEDGDGDGAGDLCDVDPVLRVSADPTDLPDFASLQEAVDAAPQSGTRILIHPGSYFGDVVLDRGMRIDLIGLDDGSGEPVILEGDGTALHVKSTRNGLPITVRNLTLRGIIGLFAEVDTVIRNCRFDSSAQSAIDLFAGDHLVSGVTITGDLVTRGFRIRSGATAEVADLVAQDLSGDAVWAVGNATFTNALVTGSVAGFRYFPDSQLALRYVTLGENQFGIVGDEQVVPPDSPGNVSVSDSIAWGNVRDIETYDLIDPCTLLVRTITGTIGDYDCSGVAGNLHIDPKFEPGAFTVSSNSPALDAGPDPALHTGAPCLDIAGGPRLRDHDGDGLAQTDIGAFERENAGRVPGDVQNLRWVAADTMVWDTEPSATEYNLYRGALSELAYDHFGDCRNDLDGDRGDTQLVDGELPAAGMGFFYAVGAEAFGQGEGTTGVGTCAERSAFAACP